MEMIISELARNIPVKMVVDVLVVGGGPAGIMAAQAAGEYGINVALVESRSFLGGNLTFGLPILGFHSQKGIQIIKGLPEQFVNRLIARGASTKIQRCPLHMSIAFTEPEAIKMTAFEVLKENKVKVLLHTFCAGIIADKEIIRGILIESKAGREAILADMIIDCTGDADVAFRAGVPCERGDYEGRVQSSTLEFSMGNVDTDKLRLSIAREPEIFVPDYIPASYYEENDHFILVGLRDIVNMARKDGISMPVDKTVIITGLRKGEMWINMTRVNGVDGTDPVSLTEGEYNTRKQIETIARFFNNYVPGFEKSYVLRTAPAIGIRETRRIIGKYVLTRDDILNRRRFDDAVTVSSYPIDIHHPLGGGFSLEWSGDCYDIPYRSLIPIKIENLIVAGRCISTTHDALGSVRVMAPCMAMGEAAGRAAALSVSDNVTPAKIDVQKLRAELLSKGAFLNE